MELFLRALPGGVGRPSDNDRLPRRAGTRYRKTMTPGESLEELPLHSRTSIEWGRSVLTEPLRLLVDHAFLEKKAANTAMELMTQWPDDWTPGWVETI